MRSLVVTLLVLALACPPLGAQQPAVPPQAVGKLNIVIVEGEGAINNVRQRVNREPIVQVEDENRKPVAGAVVVFFLPDRGPSGVFLNGDRSMTVVTDSQGRAAARGIRFNNAAGQMQIRVTASFAGQTASTVITQTNVAAAAAAAAGGGISAKLITILAVAGAAAAGGITYAATRNGNGGTPTTPTVPSISLTPGSPTVGGPRP